MSMDFAVAANDVVQSSVALTRGLPEAMAGFSALGKGAYADKVLSRKFKELIALALGVAARCDGCVAYHARKLCDLGATREEVLETLGVAVQMVRPWSMAARRSGPSISSRPRSTRRTRPSSPRRSRNGIHSICLGKALKPAVTV